MSRPEEDLRSAVEDVLDSAWPHERQRASRRWHLSTLGRVIIGLVGFYGLALMTYLLFGLALPWTFYVFIGGMTAAAALHDARNPHHLRQEEPR